jgi:LysM repeat protein
MRSSKKIKSILLGTSLTLGLSALITANAYAYTPGTAIYTAVSGDSLYKISRVFHTTVDTIMNENNLKNYSLNIGQELKVPGDTYTVQRGDTLFLIAQKYKMPLAELQRANSIYTDKLDVGQVLAVPVTGQVSTPTPAPSPTPAPAPHQLQLRLQRRPLPIPLKIWISCQG